MTGRNDRTPPVVLIVDDEHRALQSLPRLISSEDLDPVWVADEQTAVTFLEAHPGAVRIIIVDLKSTGMGGGGFLQRARQLAPEASLLVTGPLGPFLYRGGAFYEFRGPTLKNQINAVLASILGDEDPTAPIRKGQPGTVRREHFGALIGRSRAINETYSLIDRLRESEVTVLLQGESGTGKELVARTIHQTSPRARGPFVAINCGAIPSTLMESELFGHERGAFTGAVSQRKGKFEVARGGTLFLDEIGELDRDLQVKLLRVLQEREFQRVGGNATQRADVRILAATSQDLREGVRRGYFRDDLYYRLNVVPVFLPPLRERREDIPLLLEHFLEDAATRAGRPVPSLGLEARTALTGYGYPGNVRELANLVERLVVLCPNGEVGVEDLPVEVRREAGDESGGDAALRELPEGGVSLKQVERELIRKTLERVGGNKVAAARMLGITRRLLYLRLDEYGLRDVPCHRGEQGSRPVSPEVTAAREVSAMH